MSEARLASFAEKCRASGFFAAHELFAARAPGRLDVMGGIADYSGSMVLEQTISESAHVAFQSCPGDTVEVRSGEDVVRCTWADMDSINNAAKFFSGKRSWAGYVVGCASYLLEHYGRDNPELTQQSLRVMVDSEVPIGKGVSSSAALEVASMRALAAMWAVELDGLTLAKACQQVEHLVAGAPCGLMDQVTSACGEEARLLRLFCQPDQIQGHSPLPGDLRMWGIDSGIRHAVSGSDYGSVRCAAFMGQRICLGQLKDNEALRSWLVNIGSDAWEDIKQQIPENMSGADFIERYGDTLDSATSIDPQRQYAVRACTEHPIAEHARVLAFIRLLSEAKSQQRNEQLGHLMYQAHASYSLCGLGSEGTDDLVHRFSHAQATGAPVYGAKITGGGSGGTVAVLSDNSKEATDAVMQVAEAYRHDRGVGGHLFQGSSPGAMYTPVVQC